ncbi:mutator type transposase [Tanacetum coccineum]
MGTRIAVKLPPTDVIPDLVPKAYIAYGMAQELRRGHFVTNCHTSDARATVNDGAYSGGIMKKRWELEVPSFHIVIFEGIYTLCEKLGLLLDHRVSVAGGYHGRFVCGRGHGITRNDNMRGRGNYGGSAQVIGDSLLLKFVRQAIVATVTSGNKRFLLGTDSAHHDRLKKECACECAGVFNVFYALSVYAKANIISGGNVGTRDMPLDGIYLDIYRLEVLSSSRDHELRLTLLTEGSYVFASDVSLCIATQESWFSLKVKYAGFFTESIGRSYVNDDFAFFDYIDIDEFLVHELNDIVKKIGFSGKTIMYYSFLKSDISLDNGLYALGNDEDVRRMAKYIRLGYNMIEVFIELDKTTVFTYIDAAYNTPKSKCVIMEIPDGVSPKNAPINKMKPRRLVSRICAKQLMLWWKQNDANVIGESSSRHEDGESSQPNTTNLTTQTDFANDFYSASDPFLGEDDFDPFFGLDSQHVDATTARNEYVDKGKWVALDDDQIYVAADNNMEIKIDDGNSDRDSSEHDELVDTDNK